MRGSTDLGGPGERGGKLSKLLILVKSSKARSGNCGLGILVRPLEGT